MSKDTNRKKPNNESGPNGRQWKAPWWLYCSFLALAMYFSLIVGSVYEEHDLIYAIISKASKYLQETPYSFNLKLCFGQNLKATLGCFSLLFFAIAFYVLMDLSKNRNYMMGKEYGTSDWISPEIINKRYANKKNPNANRIYSQNVRISMNGRFTGINNNALVIGGSGVGKSFYFLTPNIFQADKDSKYPGSYIFTDPKGELLLNNGAYFKSKGYVVKQLNLVPGKMKESDRFNPFVYIRDISDIRTLVDNIFANTTPEGQSSSDPFWDNSAKMLLEALITLVWMEHDWLKMDMNMASVLALVNKAEIDDKGKSPLDSDFNRLAATKGENHQAYVTYRRCMKGAADTLRSILMTLISHINVFDDPELLRILSGDDLDLASIGTGITSEGEKNVKTALFCVIPDSVTTYNCIAGMMYTLLFKELYYQADFVYKGKLPVPVTFWLDEFANIALPPDFKRQLTTMRSRLISCIIIIQNLAQIKAMYEKDWEVIPGNCDVCVYLGGNEQSTFEYISKNLGKKTIWKKSRGESRGQHGSSSTNDDVLGRELMLPEEVRELDNDYCIVFVRGKKPVFDRKFDTPNSEEFKKSVELGSYNHRSMKEPTNEIVISFATEEDLAKYGGEIYKVELSDEDLRNEINEELSSMVEYCKENGFDTLKIRETYDISNKSVEEILSDGTIEFDKDQYEQITLGIYNGLSDDEIKSYITYEFAEDMKSRRMLLEALKNRKRMEGN